MLRRRTASSAGLSRAQRARHHTKAYPTTNELLRFGTEVGGVAQPHVVLGRIAQAMQETLEDAKRDARIPASLLAQMEPLWQAGIQYAQ